jgi:hypothetical protein
VNSHWAHSHREFQGVDPDTADYGTIEALSDQNFRTVYEIQFIWQMGLWRIIALHDGLLSQWHPTLARKRLQEKLDSLERSGLLAASDSSEIRDWIRLRNVLSHRPVEGHGLLHQLSQDDLKEVPAVARRVLSGARPATSPGTCQRV